MDRAKGNWSVQAAKALSLVKRHRRQGSSPAWAAGRVASSDGWADQCRCCCWPGANARASAPCRGNNAATVPPPGVTGDRAGPMGGRRHRARGARRCLRSGHAAPEALTRRRWLCCPRRNDPAPAPSGCRLFRNEGRNRFPLYPVDLRAEVCAALPDLAHVRQMWRN